MIRKENGAIILDGTVNQALNYKDSGLCGDDFIATLVEELEKYINCTRAGTKGRHFPTSSLEQASEGVLKVVDEFGLVDREAVIREAFNVCSTTSPTVDWDVEYYYSPFLVGFDLQKECTLSRGIVCTFNPRW